MEVAGDTTDAEVTPEDYLPLRVYEVRMKALSGEAVSNYSEEIQCAKLSEYPRGVGSRDVDEVHTDCRTRHFVSGRVLSVWVPAESPGVSVANRNGTALSSGKELVPSQSACNLLHQTGVFESFWLELAARLGLVFVNELWERGRKIAPVLR